ncbi:MAG TPA: alanine racemase [Acidimicrobiales bacterium]|nr:alanine racemase [Acidimicrobiales bacterium]
MTFILRDLPDDKRVIGANLLDGPFELPRLVVKQSALEHNITAMTEYCRVNNVSLAPHAKTTMVPAIIRRQVDCGAWAMTVATMQQLHACMEMGVKRLLLANEVVNARAAEWLGRELAARGSGHEAYCLVDSVQGVAELARGLGASGLARKLPVLVEVGPAGGRAGCRTVKDALAVARSVAKEPALRLAGVEGFEGIIGASRSAETLDAVDRFLEGMQQTALTFETEGLFGLPGDESEVILTAGGSTFFDRVATVLTRAPLAKPYRVVLRSGCYVTHDHGSYGGPAPLTGELDKPGFLPALELWSEVLSKPEPGRAIAGFGRRDAPFDAGLPVLLGRVPAGEPGPRTQVDGTVAALNDQHAHIVGSPELDLTVGDRVVCGIRHPCTAFDKWRKLLMVDDDYTVVEVLSTWF